MALLCAEHHSVPVLFPLGEDGHAIVISTTLSLRFRFRDVTIFVEEEIFDDQTRLVSHAVRQTRQKNDVDLFWLLKPGKYRVYGVSESKLECSTEHLTTKKSSTVSIERPLMFRVKIEPSPKTIYELSDDSDGDVEVLRLDSKIQISLSPQIFCKETTPPVGPSRDPSQAKVVASQLSTFLTFYETKDEDPSRHVERFVERVISSIITNQQHWLVWFPTTLDGEAYEWYRDHDEGHFQTWDQLHREFLNEFWTRSRSRYGF